MRLVFNPTVADFERIVAEAVSSAVARTIYIVYCGHGCSDGSLYFADDCYLGSEFAAFLNNNKPQHLPQAGLVLNCCNGIHFISALLQETIEASLKKFDGFAGPALGENFSFDKEDWEETTGDLMVKLFHHKNLGIAHSPVFYSWGNISLSCWPLSFGVMPGQGRLHKLFGIETSPLTLTFRNLPWWENQDCISALARGTSIPADTPDLPTFTVFQGQDGESTLLQWQSLNILIDGGRGDRPPAFWPHVSGLTELQLVALTHGDADHVNGFLPFFKRKQSEKDNPTEGMFAVLLEVSQYYHSSFCLGWKVGRTFCTKGSRERLVTRE